MISEKNDRNIILIVDDNPTNLDILFDFLRKYGFKVLVALNGESAIKQIERIRPDLILLDVMMPGIDGFETCKRLKADLSMQEIPVIFMTALSDTVDKVKGFEVGAVDYITKPFQHEEVLSRIKTHLTIRNLQKSLQERNEELAELNEHLAHLNQNLEKLVEQKTKQLLFQEKAAIIGRLTQGLVHNLRNPIQTIMTSVDLIEGTAKKNEIQTILNYSQYITRSISKINQIMDTLMLKFRSEKEEELKFLNINEILQREIQLLEANLRFKHKVSKKYLFDESIGKIPLIDSHFCQVFHNLIDNGIDAMWNQKHQELTLVTRQDEKYIYLDIKDTGCGIQAENLSQIFDPFYTSKPAKGEELEPGAPTGTGLGLYTCLELLKPFNAEIEVTSEVGKGSVFTVIFPKQVNG
ncbi:MAG: response regulator [Actinomycetota bacterium]